jgi:large subunit ribosomal protein L5
MSTLKKLYYETIQKELEKKFKYKNVMMIPKLEKIVINRGLGEAVTNAKAVDMTVKEIQRITGQKPVITRAKKSVSNFKIREGQAIGCKVTLRSKKMYDFLTKLIKLSLPKIRDFRGVPFNSFDGRGNYTLGIKEGTIFPEIVYDQIDQIRGYDITFVTSAKTDDEAYSLLELFGMPFRKR